MTHTPMTQSTKPFPPSGRPASQILSTLHALKHHDAQWKQGRTWSLVYYAGEEHYAFLQDAFGTFFSENGLNPAAFPSLRQMESEVVAMTASLLGGGEDTVGNMTSGGTESILMALLTAKEWAKTHMPRVKTPQVVVPTSVHPAFEKAAHYFGLKLVHVPVGPDFRADLRATKRAMNRNTILLVGSAPAYPQGVVDPIEELARLAKTRGILCHVDACVGGYLLPFLQKLGYALPPFGFEVDGVTSLSVDIHKYGYAAKGASVILYKDAQLRRHQYFAYTDWTGGIYVSPAMAGTRPGGPIAAAWAMIHRLGEEGYMDIAQRVMAATQKLKRGIEQIPDLEILGHPPASLLSVGAKERDIYQIADELTLKGWHFDRQQHPPSLHLTVSQGNIQSVDEFLEDLRHAVELTPPVTAEQRLKARVTSMALGGMVKLLPERMVSKITTVAADKLGMDLSDGDLPERSAAMYGMMATLPNRGDVQELVIDALDGMTRYQKASDIQFVETTHDPETSPNSPSTPPPKAKAASKKPPKPKPSDSLKAVDSPVSTPAKKAASPKPSALKKPQTSKKLRPQQPSAAKAAVKPDDSLKAVDSPVPTPALKSATKKKKASSKKPAPQTSPPADPAPKPAPAPKASPSPKAGTPPEKTPTKADPSKSATTPKKAASARPKAPKKGSAPSPPAHGGSES